jgi:hypothetical protein
MPKDYHARDIHYKPRQQDLSTVRDRDCLRCDVTFKSEGSYQRLCKKCREFLDASPSAEKTYTLSHER